VFVDVTADTYTSQHMLEMEMKILTALDFCLVKPTTFNFVELLGLASHNRSMSLYAI
jgi:hypothetical protein